MIIGLTGSYASGKDTAAEYLIARGFLHFSLSDELRAVLAERGVPPTRENLIRIGTELRASDGSGVLARRVAARFEKNRNYVITSIRHPAEVEELKSCPGFVLVAVDAPANLRFERMAGRKRPGDPRTFEEFLSCERRESQTEGPGQQLDKTAALASHVLVNDAGREQLFRAIDDLLARLTP